MGTPLEFTDSSLPVLGADPSRGGIGKDRTEDQNVPQTPLGFLPLLEVDGPLAGRLSPHPSVLKANFPKEALGIVLVRTDDFWVIFT